MKLNFIYKKWGEQYQLALCNVSVQAAHIHWIHISNSNTAVLNKKLNIFALKNITDTEFNATFKLIKKFSLSVKQNSSENFWSKSNWLQNFPWKKEMVWGDKNIALYLVVARDKNILFPLLFPV